MKVVAPVVDPARRRAGTVISSVVVPAALLIALVVPSTAAAQPGAVQPAPPLDAFLEQRVVEELASNGIVLSRLGVSLDVELVGGYVLVSLVDLATRRVAASTKLDAPPVDREAAVAMVTQIAANLAAQLGGPPVQPAPVLDPIAEDRAERERRERAEQRYRSEAIGFGEDIRVSGTADVISTTRHWYASQGELKVRLEPAQFYKLIERPDLYAGYKARERKAIIYGVTTLGLIGVTVGTVIKGGLTSSRRDYSSCVGFDFDCRNRVDDKAESDALPYYIAGGVAGVTSVVTLFLGAYYATRMHPITESEAKRLATEHNQKLRHELGLPTATSRPRRLQDVAWAPYATATGGGFALSGRF